MKWQANILNFTTANDRLFLPFLFLQNWAGTKEGRVTPLLIQHVSDCWMTERRCHDLWLSGLDPGGRTRRGGAEKRWTQVCDKSWFPPILPNHPHRLSLFQLFPPFKVWLWMSQWQIISPPQGRAGSHGRKRSRASLCSPFLLKNGQLTCTCWKILPYQAILNKKCVKIYPKTCVQTIITSLKAVGRVWLTWL